MHALVQEALYDISKGRHERYQSLWLTSDRSRDARLAILRRSEAERRGKKQPFLPRSNYGLALTEWKCREYREQGRLVVLDEENPDLIPLLAPMRHNHLVGDGKVTTEEFRRAGHEVCKTLYRCASAVCLFNPVDAADSYIWRAALLAIMAALELGFKSHFHFDAKRDEVTADCSAIRYYEKPAEFLPWSAVVNLDFMLATGGSDAKSILKLQELGIPEEKIVVLAGIAAPEGVDRLLDEFPRILVMTVALDERLNEKAYIVPGLGDAGDQAAFTLEDVDEWRKKGILNSRSWLELQERVRKSAIQVA